MMPTNLFVIVNVKKIAGYATEIHVLLSTLYYMFRRLLHHLQGDLLSYAKKCYKFD